VDIDRFVLLVKHGTRVARSVRNWFEVEQYFRHNGNGDKTIDLHFRKSLSFSCVERGTARALLTYYYRAHSMKIFCDDDLSALFEISSDIQSKLSSVFTEEEKRKCDAGTWIGRKEALLFCLIRGFRPSIVVETGVAQGVSSYLILKALELNGYGRLVSIDFPQQNPEGYTYQTCDPLYISKGLKSGWLVPRDLRKFWTLKLGKSSEILPTINDEVDVFFHDSEHSYRNMKFEFEWAYTHLSAGGVITSDDVGWNSAWTEFILSHTDLQWCLRGEGLAVAVKRSSLRRVDGSR
jgi:predicted O-methyltransferase YrrM